MAKPTLEQARYHISTLLDVIQNFIDDGADCSDSFESGRSTSDAEHFLNEVVKHQRK